VPLRFHEAGVRRLTMLTQHGMAYPLIEGALDKDMTTTTKLLDAAEYRMRRGGYNAVSFRDLAEDTGIKSSSVHYHFPKKEDLGVALVKRYSERFFAALTEASEGAGTLPEKLAAYQSVYRAALIQDDAICLCGLLGAEIPCLPPSLEAATQSFFRNNINWVEDALPSALNTDEKSRLAETLLAGHQGAMMLATSMKNKALFETVTGQLIDVTLLKCGTQ